MRVVVVVLGLGAVSAGGAFAQERATQPETDVILVTGIGPERVAGELLQSTTVIDADQTIDRLDGGLGDTLAGLPGVTSTSFGPGASRPVIRGLGAERVQVLTNGVGVIDASAASPDHAVSADPLGAERIEVLRGPAALAYGGGAAGGVVNVLDGLIAERRPDRALSGRGYAGWTSVDEGSTLAGRVAAAGENVVGVLRASRRDLDAIDIPGFAESGPLRALEAAEGEAHEQESGVLDNSFSETTDVSGGVSFVGETGFIGFAVRRGEATYGLIGGHEEEEEAVLSLPSAVAAPLGAGDEEAPFIDMEQTRYDVRAGVTLPGFVRSLTGAASIVDYEHTEFEASGEPGTFFANEGYEGRVELTHAPVSGVEGAVGVQASRRDFQAVGDEAFVTPTVTEQAGVFIFETFERDRYGLEGGLRFDHVELSNALAGDRTFDTFNASFGVHGHVTEQMFLGLAIARTERAPTDVELFADGPHLATRQFEIGDADLSTETGVNIEAIARWEAGRATFGASLYAFAFQDFIFLSPTGDEEDGLPVFVTMQEDADFTGAELSGEYRFGLVGGVDWTLDGSFDIVSAELSDGSPLPRIPPVSARAGLTGELGRVRGTAAVEWAGEQDEVAGFELPTDGWTRLDLRFDVSLTEKIVFILEGTNLTDEEIRLHASPLKDFAPQAGRGVRIGLRAAF